MFNLLFYMQIGISMIAYALYTSLSFVNISNHPNIFWLYLLNGGLDLS